MKKGNIGNRKKRQVYVSVLLMVATLWCVMSTDLRICASESNGADYEKLVEALAEELRDGNLSTKEDVQNAIDKVEEKYGVNISDSDEEKIVKLVDVAEELGIDGEKMADIVEDVYDNAIDGKVYDNTEEMINAVQNQIIDSAADTVKEAVATSVKNSISDYYRTFVDRIKSFWSELISKWKIL